jgi:hypothetical protein
MRPKLKLRLDGLPKFETSPLFVTLETSTEAALKRLPNAYERAVAALRFCQNIGADGESLRVSEDHVHIMQVAYLRAALMEYVAIEEVLPVDLKTSCIEEEPLRIFDTGNAMLVLLRELRYVQLHLVNTLFDSSKRSAVLRTKKEDWDHKTELTILTIPSADLQQLKTLRNASRFDRDELDAAISWFSYAQAQWGIQDVVLCGIRAYATALVQRYGLVAV